MREIKGVTGEAASRGLVFAGAVDAPPRSCFSSFVLRSPCCAPPLPLTSVPPPPACCGNIYFFICCFQRVALSLEDDGYP